LTEVKPSVSIIIPTLNEEKGIVKTIEKIPKDVRKVSEVIVVDGLSKDKTIENARKLGAKVIVEKRRGKGLAMITGAKCAKGEFLLFVDGDGTYQMEKTQKFISELKNNDLVIGNAMPYIQKIRKKNPKMMYSYSSLWFHKTIFSMLGIDLEEPLNGMRAIKKEDFFKLGLTSQGFEIETEMNIKAAKSGLKLKEVSIKSYKRLGMSKFNVLEQIRVLKYIVSFVLSDFIIQL
jgi:glycosyltransferase involved in cell wall biosynthesis